MRKLVTRERFINFNSKNMWVPFKYEKLPKICFYYGRIVHGEGVM